MREQFCRQIRHNSSLKNFNLAKQWLYDMKENVYGQSGKQTSFFRARINEIIQVLELEENRRTARKNRDKN